MKKLLIFLLTASAAFAANVQIQDIATSIALPAANTYMIASGATQGTGKVAMVSFPQITNTRTSLAALSITNVPTGVAVQTLGGSAVGDGSSGLYYYNSASSATPNGTTIIQPAVGSGRWLIAVNSALPTPSSSTLGGVFSKAGVSHQYLSALDTAGNFTLSTVSTADVSGLGTMAVQNSGAVSITGGSIANAATTATSANTASAIVARDASGNFSAGTGTFSVLIGSTNINGGNLTIKAGQLNELATNGLAALQFNYDGYNGGTTQFRNTEVYDGKNALVARFTGSTKAFDVVGALTASNLSGTNTGDQTNIAGNAGTATILQTTRTIGGVNFNGSANITSFPSPGAIGGTTPSTGAFTTVTSTGGILVNAITGLGYTVGDGTVTGVMRTISGPALAIGTTSNHSLSFWVNSAAVGQATATGLNGMAIGQTTPAASTFTTTSWSSNANIRTTKGNLYLVETNVRDYGATGNGVTNDLAAIQAAVAALPSEFGTLYFPPGRYNVGATSSALEIDGKAHLTIYGNGAEIYDGNSAAGQTVLRVKDTCSYVKMSGLFFNGNATSRVPGNHMVIFDASHSQITNCSFRNGSEFSLYIGSNNAVITTDVLVNGCLINDTWSDGIHINCANYVQVFGCGIDNTGDDGIGIVRDSLSSVTPPSQIQVIACNIKNSGYGPGGVSGSAIHVLEAVDVLLADNAIDYNYQTSISVTRYLSTTAYNARIKILNNTIVNSNQHAGELGSINIGFCQGAKIMGNKIDNPANGGGIGVLDCNDMTISENDFRNIPNRIIYFNDFTTSGVASNCYRIDITNNHFLYSTANQAVYVVPPPGTTLNDLVIDGNIGHTLPGGDWIYYDRINTGKITNNVHTGSQTIGAGGSVASVTLVNNN